MEVTSHVSEVECDFLVRREGGVDSDDLWVCRVKEEEGEEESVDYFIHNDCLTKISVTGFITE